MYSLRRIAASKLWSICCCHVAYELLFRGKKILFRYSWYFTKIQTPPVFETLSFFIEESAYVTTNIYHYQITIVNFQWLAKTLYLYRFNNNPEGTAQPMHTWWLWNWNNLHITLNFAVSKIFNTFASFLNGITIFTVISAIIIFEDINYICVNIYLKRN